MKFLLVDDHPILCDAIARLIEISWRDSVCLHCSNEAEAWMIFETQHPDCVILDINLDIRLLDTDGLTLLKRIRSVTKTIPVAVISMYETPQLIQQCFREGANGYISKKEQPVSIMKAIQMIMDGKEYISDILIPILVHDLQSGKISVEQNHFPKLSKRELQIFTLMGEGISAKEIACQLNLSSRTVDTHIERIREKLHVDSRHQLMFLAFQEKIKKNDKPFIDNFN